MSQIFTIEDLKKSKVAGINQNLFTNQKPKKSKYGSVIIEFDGKKFRSLKERNYYIKLRMLLKAGEISNLRLQVPYELNPNGTHSLKYYADFVYLQDGKEIVVDVKGFRTNVYKKKRALMLQVHGIEVKEYLPMHVIPEPRTCKKFGCGKVLTRQESLFGDLCIDCQGRKGVDIMDVLKME